MLLTFSHIIGGVLLYCGHPPETALARGFICEIGLDKITYYITELNLTDENWLLMRGNLNVEPGRTEYSLGGLPAFGRPVLIETKDDADPYHVRREIEVIDFQDRKLLYDGPPGVPASTYSMHNARSMSVYSRNMDKKITVDPDPSAAATYGIYYEPDTSVPQSLVDSAFPLEQFGGLLKTAIALPCLAQCGWDDIKHKRLQEAVLAEFTGYHQQFERYIKQDSQPRSSVGRAFGPDDYSVWEF